MFTDNAETVPTAAKPIVPNSTMSRTVGAQQGNGEKHHAQGNQKGLDHEHEYQIGEHLAKIDRLLRSTGVSNSPSRLPLSFSKTKDRFNPRTPEKLIATQRTPGTTCLALSTRRSNANWKMITDSNASNYIAKMSSAQFRDDIFPKDGGYFS